MPRIIKRYDTQRARVYAAEQALPKDCGARDRLLDLTAVQAYVDRVTDLAWFRRRWGRRKITARTKRGGGGYSPAGSNIIAVGLNVTSIQPGTTKALVLHEIGHVVTRLPDDQPRNWHGPSFVRTVLELYRFEFGEAAYDLFRAACKQQNARVGSPTALLPAESVPDARPVTHTWRVQLGKDELLILQGTSLAAALAQLVHSPSYYARFKAADATEVRIWKSRAVNKAASKGAKP